MNLASQRNRGDRANLGARIVFDLDGTLIDSAPDIQNIANAGLAGIGVAPITIEETHAFIGEGIQKFVQRMRNARDVPDTYQNLLLEDLTARYDVAVKLTVTYPGVRKALTTLSQSHQLGVCTNKLRRPCMNILRHLNIDHFFTTIWAGDNQLARKPDPAPLHAAFDDLGTGSRIYVGDSEIDAETARRAEVPFILYTQGYRKMSVRQIPHDVAFDAFTNLTREVDRILNKS